MAYERRLSVLAELRDAKIAKRQLRDNHRQEDGDPKKILKNLTDSVTSHKKNGI